MMIMSLGVARCDRQWWHDVVDGGGTVVVVSIEEGDKGKKVMI